MDQIHVITVSRSKRHSIEGNRTSPRLKTGYKTNETNITVFVKLYIYTQAPKKPNMVHRH